MTTLTATWTDSLGDVTTFEGESLEEVAKEFAAAHGAQDEDKRINQRLTVRDEAGFVRGWIHSDGEYFSA